MASVRRLEAPADAGGVREAQLRDTSGGWGLLADLGVRGAASLRR